MPAEGEGTNMEQLFLKILNMSITACYCVLVVLLLRLIMQKMPKIYSYVLWAVVYFRLVCPLSIKSVFSLIKVNPQTIPMDISMRKTPRIYSGSARVDAVVNEGIQRTVPAVEQTASANPMQVILCVAAAVWVTVAALLLIYSIWSVFRLKRRLKDASWVEENIYESSNLQTPFVMGLFKPCIYLPADLGKQERNYVLAHERTHIRRRDYLLKQIAFLVTCIYWFHPLIWLSFYLMCRDMEMSCDESVIRKLGREVKKEYSASLLSLASGKQIINGSPLAFGEGGIRARISNVLHYKRPARFMSILFVVILAVVLLGLALNPKEGKEDYKKGEMPAKIADMRMASGTVEHDNGERISVELWLLEGVYFDEEYAGAGGGIYPENYQGHYELRTVNEQGEVSDTVDLNADWLGEEGGTINFPEEFEILFTDYNRDKNPDFTIGTYGSSSMNLFYLYTVDGEGKIRRLCETEIPSQLLMEYSVVFEHDTEAEGMPFLSYCWNNATGRGEHHFYCLNDRTGLYERDETAETDNGSAEEETADLIAENTDAGRQLPGYQTPTVHLHTSDYLSDSMYIDLTLLTEEESDALAVRALQELYDLTGTQVEECCYYYDTFGGFVFAMTEEDMNRGRTFYSRNFGEDDFAGETGIKGIYLTNARRLWYSPIYQYHLPEDFDSYEDSEKAVWFLKQSALYNGKEVAECIQPYSAMPETWRLIMEDDTAYEISLDLQIDSVTDITGPYPDSNINH